MEYENNTVAKIFKIYAILNAVACFIFMYVLIAADYLDTLGVIIWLAASTVINFEIYAVGEVIQILDDIKQNTASEPFREAALPSGFLSVLRAFPHRY